MSNSKGSHFLPSDKLCKTAKRKIEPEAIRGIQTFAEKMIQDIITRSTLLAQHAETDIIDAVEICNVIEKNYDSTFGIKVAHPEKNNATDSHIEKMAEISKQK